VLLPVGIVIRFIWCFFGAAALMGQLFVAREIMRDNRKRSDPGPAATRKPRRGPINDQWVRQDDNRGNCGADGARLMRYVQSAGRPIRVA
jgi:hypothetical protein